MAEKLIELFLDQNIANCLGNFENRSIENSENWISKISMCCKHYMSTVSPFILSKIEKSTDL
jgi:hypothetical protein